jgi:hypothetical protein
MNRLTIVGAVLAATLHSATASAQAVRLSSESKPTYQVFAASGFDDAVLPIKLGGMLAFSAAGRPLTVGATFQMPLLAPSFDDFTLKLFGEYDLNRDYGWLVRPQLWLAVQGTGNGVFDATGLELGGGVFGGWSAPRWAVGAEVVGHFNVVSHLRAKAASQQYHRLSSDAVVWGDGGILELGARGGVVLGPVELSLRAGWQRRGAYSQAPPVYAQLAVGFRWH